MTVQLDLFEESIDNETKLTPRAWALYRLIYHNSLVEHRKTSAYEICEKLAEYGYKYDYEKKSHDPCSAIWKDIKDNNESLEHEKIIISKNFEYWIGSEQETREFINGLWKALAPRLTRYWNYLKKINMDGIYKLFDKNGNQNQTRQFYECFNAYNIEMQKELANGNETENN